MEGTCPSFFKGAESIHLNNSAQERLQEQEALEDQKRYEAELKMNLANQLGDFIEDDDVSYHNSTADSTMDRPTCNGIYEGDGHHNGTNNNVGNNELEYKYKLLANEFQQLLSQHKELQDSSNLELNSLRTRLQAALNDKSKAELSQHQTMQLLESSKHEIKERDQQIMISQNKLIKQKCEYDQLNLELKATTLSLQDSQSRLQTMQVTHNNDAYFREQQKSHDEEINRLHTDLQKLKRRLEEREDEIKMLEKRCVDIEKSKEQMFLERSGTVDRLSQELTRVQSQRQMANSEAERLKEKLEEMTMERNTAAKQTKNFASKLQVTANELNAIKKKYESSLAEMAHWRNLQMMLSETVPDGCFTDEPPSPSKLSKLKDVLTQYRCQSLKIASLQEELSIREKKLEYQKKIEAELRERIEDQRTKETQLTSKVTLLQNKLDLLDNKSEVELLERYKMREIELKEAEEEARALCKNWELKCAELQTQCEKLKSENGDRSSKLQDTNADLQKELKKYSGQLKATQSENAELKNLYLQICSERDTVTREINDIQTKHKKEREQLNKELNESDKQLQTERQRMTSLKEELENCKIELERAESRMMEMQKEFMEKQKDFTNKSDKYLQDEKSSMLKELESCAQCDKHMKVIRELEEQINKYNVKLATQESNKELMHELKGQAEFFQKYIFERFQRLQEQRTVGTNTDHDNNNPRETAKPTINGCIDDDEDLKTRTNIMMKEREIRDQMAQKFTLEMKTVEMNCAKRIKEIENENINNMTRLKQLVEKKAQEVETLKEFILSERTKVQEILDAKENEYSVVLKEHNTLQRDLQVMKDKAAEYKSKVEKYQEKYRMVEEKYKSDKENSKKSIGEVEKEKQELYTKLLQLETELQTLKAKYKSAKKTAYMYKDYISKKDEHVNGELNRIQNEYKDIFVKLQGQLNYLVNYRIQATQAGSSKESHDYSEVINRLQNDLTALAQSRYNEPTDWKGK